MHAPCAHNMVHGLLLRTMGPTPEPSKAGLTALQRAFREVRRVVLGRVVAPIEQWDFDRVASSYREKRMRVRYEQAAASLRNDGLCTRKDAKVKAFVKGEKLANYKIHKPRIIMGRDPRYNLELASFLKPIEHAVYPALRGWGNLFLTHTRLIGKGLNQNQRAALIDRKFSSKPRLVAMEIDGKSFESHFVVPVLRGEHSVYKRLNSDPRLAELLGWQEEFAGAGSGVRFKVKGVRASGDFNTGLGNTITMCSLVLASAKALGLRFDMIVDGDNALLFVFEEDLNAWRLGLPEQFLEMGFEVTLSDPMRSVEECVFGQSKPLLAAGKLTMVRDPFKVLSHAACGYQHYADMRGGLRVLKSVAYCEAVLNRGVPVLQALAHAMLKATQGVSFANAIPENYEHRTILSEGIDWSKAVEADIPAETRIGFERSWGVSPDEQVRMEAYLSKGFCPPDKWDVPLECELPDGRDLWTLVSHTHSDIE